VQNVEQVERQLQDETAKLAERLAPAEAYTFVLRQSAEEIQAAAERLGRRQTDAKTVSLESEAWSRLRNVVQALKAQQKPRKPSQQASQGNENQNRENGPNTEPPVPAVAQLQLLKIVQQDLLRRTGDLDRQRRETTSAADVTDELARLTREQGDLAKLIERLAAQFFRGADGEHQVTPPPPRSTK
jgi:hypothetical protein